MTILHIHDRVGRYGGGEVYLSQLREGIQRLGHRSPVLYLTETGTERDLGADAFCAPKPHGLLSGLRMRRWLGPLLEQLKPDVVHCHCLFSPAGMAWLCARVPTLLTLHSLHLLPRTTGSEPMTVLGLYERFLRRLMRPVLRRLTGWIAPSEAFAGEILGEGFEGVSVVPHFTDKRPSAQARGPERGRILFVGRLSAEKGIEALLDTLALLHARSWHAVIVGEGPMEAYAKARVERESFGERVTFVGWCAGTALDREYERASLVVVPSTVMEAFGLVGIEALAFGKPVAAFDAGGVREWLEEGRTGYVVRQGDCAALAARIDALLEDPDSARDMGEAGRRLVEARFRLESHLGHLFLRYEEAVRRRIPGRLPAESYACRH